MLFFIYFSVNTNYYLTYDTEFKIQFKTVKNSLQIFICIIKQ